MKRSKTVTVGLITTIAAAMMVPSGCDFRTDEERRWDEEAAMMNDFVDYSSFMDTDESLLYMRNGGRPVTPPPNVARITRGGFGVHGSSAAA